MSLPKEVHIQECCPRDGWQNHAEFIPTDVKIKYIRCMIDCGAKAGSYQLRQSQGHAPDGRCGRRV